MFGNFAIDADECMDGTSTCQETCTNTIGSYTCGCIQGFRLNSDGRTCYGMPILQLVLSILLFEYPNSYCQISMSVQREQISAKYTVTTLLGHTYVAVVLVSSLTPQLEVHVLVSITIAIVYTSTTLRLSFLSIILVCFVEQCIGHTNS